MYFIALLHKSTSQVTLHTYWDPGKLVYLATTRDNLKFVKKSPKNCQAVFWHPKITFIISYVQMYLQNDFFISTLQIGIWKMFNRGPKRICFNFHRWLCLLVQTKFEELLLANMCSSYPISLFMRDCMIFFYQKCGATSVA